MSEIKTAGTQRYEIPYIHGDVYKTENSTIANGITNRAVTLTGITRTTLIEIINDNSTTGQDLYVRLNANTNDVIIVKPTEAKTIPNFKITNIYLTNSSGTTISYRINAFGV
jgi:hypothetical protein